MTLDDLQQEWEYEAELSFKAPDFRRIVKLAQEMWKEGRRIDAVNLLFQGYDGVEVKVAHALIQGDITPSEFLAEQADKQARRDALHERYERHRKLVDEALF